jgi:two-component system KDP operon response regulator KdpE
MSARVLVVGEARLAARIEAMLEEARYDVRVAGSDEAALASLGEWCPDLIVADYDVPEIDGPGLCRRVRRTSQVPIMAVSGRADPGSELAAVEQGADDYILKPFSTEKLLARTRVALRRLGAREPASLGVGEFCIDFDDRRVHVHGQPVRLTPKEFDLFVFMARNPNRVLRHRTLLGAVWGQEAEDQSEYLRVFMGQLRKKIEADPSNPRYLVTEPWVGYRFNPTGSAAH